MTPSPIAMHYAARRPRTRRAPTSTRCSRGCTPSAPDAALLRRSPHAPPLGDVVADDEAPDDAADLPAAWDALRAASAAMDADAAVEEYDDLFVGVGKSEVNLHASHWLTGFMMEKPLVEVRATLARARARPARRRDRWSRITSRRCAKRCAS